MSKEYSCILMNEGTKNMTKNGIDSNSHDPERFPQLENVPPEHLSASKILTYSEVLLTYHQTLSARLNCINDRVWPQANYFTTIIITLLALPFPILFQYYDVIVNTPTLILLLLVFPVIGIATTYIAFKSIEKIFDKTYHIIATMSKIEEKLDINQKNSSKIFPDDEYIQSPEWLPVKGPGNKIKNSKKWVEKELKSKKKIGYYIRQFYIIMMSLAILEICLIILIFINL